MSQETREKRITPLPELEASALIRKWYHIGEKIRMGDIHVNPQYVTLIGFGNKYVPRGGLNHKLAGVYIDFEKLLVATSAELASKFLFAPTKEKYDRFGGLDYPHGSRGEEELKKIADIYIRIGDLPETPFWVGDTVQDGYGCDYEFVIKGIDYFPSHKPAYNLEAVGGWISKTNGDQLRLLTRGNLWKFEHGEPIEFASIEEEALFYKSLGMSRNVTEFVSGRTPADNWRDAAPKWHCELKEALCFIRNKDADELKITTKDLKCVVIKYDNEEFGNRMRQHTLEKFGFAETAEA